MALPNRFDPDAYRLHPVRDPEACNEHSQNRLSRLLDGCNNSSVTRLHNAADWDAHPPADAVPRSQAGRSRFSHGSSATVQRQPLSTRGRSGWRIFIQETDSPPKSEKRRWWQSKSKSKLEPQPTKTSTATSRPKPVSRRKPEKTSTASQTAAKDHVETVESSKNGETKRRWLGFRKPKSPATKTKSPADDKHHAQESLVTTSATKSKNGTNMREKLPANQVRANRNAKLMKWRRKIT